MPLFLIASELFNYLQCNEMKGRFIYTIEIEIRFAINNFHNHNSKATQKKLGMIQCGFIIRTVK